MFFNNSTKKKSTGKKVSQRILIIEAYTDANVGSCALVENSLSIIHQKFPNAKIKIIAEYPDAFNDIYGISAVEDIFILPVNKPLFTKVIWFFKSSLLILFTFFYTTCFSTQFIEQSKWLPFRKKISPFLWADWIVSVGAERLNDKYYKNGPFSLYTLLLSKKLGKKVIIFPATFGPFFFRWSKFLTQKTLSQLDIIFTRDDESYITLANELSINSSKVVKSVDVAVLQQPVAEEEACNLIPGKPKEPLVGISVLRWSYFRNKIDTQYSNYESYIREIAITTNTLIEKYNVTIIFYPTNFRIHRCTNDDLSVVREIFPHLYYQNKVRIIEKLPTPAQLQGMLSRSEINITTRMHACIFSTNACIPTISINYLPKLKAYMNSLGLSQFSIDIEEFNAKILLETFAILWMDNEKWRNHLRNEIDNRKERLWESLGYLNALV
jgi:polysaccharide pyruvyl transferase WcaK-like protein